MEDIKLKFPPPEPVKVSKEEKERIKAMQNNYTREYIDDEKDFEIPPDFDKHPELVKKHWSDNDDEIEINFII